MSDTNEFKEFAMDKVDNSALIRAMKQIKEKEDNDSLVDFINEAKKSKFITPATIEGQGSRKTVKIQTLRNEKGEMFVPAFTSTEELVKHYKEKLPSIVCNFDQYLKMITSQKDGPIALVIDPSGENMLFPKELLNDIKEQDAMRISELKDEPEEMENFLRKFFDEDGTVEKAYLLVTLRLGQVNLLLVTDNRFPDGASDEEISSIREDLNHRIIEAVKPAFEEYKQLKAEYKDFGLIIADTKQELGMVAVNNREPFYRADK